MKSIEAFVEDFAISIKNVLSEKMECKVIDSYPCTFKPTVLSSPVIAVGLDKASLIPESIDEERLTGEVSVFADIFIPARMKSTLAAEIFNSMCTISAGLGIVSVSAERLSYDKLMSAYVMKTSFKFNEELIFGGE